MKKDLFFFFQEVVVFHSYYHFSQRVPGVQRRAPHRRHRLIRRLLLFSTTSLQTPLICLSLDVLMEEWTPLHFLKFLTFLWVKVTAVHPKRFQSLGATFIQIYIYIYYWYCRSLGQGLVQTVPETSHPDGRSWSCSKVGSLIVIFCCERPPSCSH